MRQFSREHFLLVLIGDEVRRQVAAIKLHAFDQIDFGGDIATFFDRDDSILADLQQGIRKDLTDFRIVVAGDGSNAGNLVSVVGLDAFGHADPALRQPRRRLSGHRD